MKKRSLIAIIMAVFCLMSSFSLYVSAASTSCSYTYYCSGESVDTISMSHEVAVGDDDTLTCNYEIVVYRTIKVCGDCGDMITDATHRHAETGHSCGRVEDRCSYPSYN